MTGSQCVWGRARARLAKVFQGYLSGRAGNVAPIIALMVVPMVGAIGMATEVSNWFLTNRAAQNAADSAVIAAATAGANNSSNDYAAEGATVATQYGFTNGANAATVAVASAVTCPDGTTACYQATITKTLPLYLTQVVGYKGTTRLSGAPATLIRASAIAEVKTVTTPDCLIGLDTAKGADDILVDGVPFSNLTGCTAQVNSDARCNGHDLGLDYILGPGAVGSGCASRQYDDAAIPDPYAGLAKNIPAMPTKDSFTHTCASAPGQTVNQVNWPTTATVTECGNLTLTGNINITSNQTIVIYNGALNLAGYKLQTVSGTAGAVGATVIFTGANAATSHVFTGSGTIDISSPTSGTWSGVAIYQDPNLPDTGGNLDVSAAGNKPILNLSGIVYLPHALITLKGAIDHASNGFGCFTFVFDELTLKGTGSIFQNPQTDCGKQGVNQTFSNIPYAYLVS